MTRRRNHPERPLESPNDAVGPAAWRMLYEGLGDRVYALLVRMLRDPELASDLTQETFVTIAEKGHQYSGRGSLDGWVFSIARNLGLEACRREASRAIKTEILAAERSDRHTITQPDTELRVVLDQALQTLPDNMRLVFLLHDVDGYTHAEIGAMLAIPPGTSKGRLSHARARMRQALQHAL